ncbi:MAG: hypothetical protein GY711_30325 [bacterium]|nr:hypothetical protein [bacterium]
MSRREREPKRADGGEGSGSARAVPSVRKRNGRIVPFDAARIRDAVLRAQAAVGEDDPLFAEEVTDVVGLTLVSRYPSVSDGPDAQVSIEEIQDLVERALIEMGRAAVAKAYILYRDRRRRAREALSVHDEDGLPPEPEDRPDRRGRMPLVRDGAGTTPWNPARIVAALMEEAELPRELAEDVAERVEGRVFDAGLRRVSTTLVREFVDNELRSMGFDGGRTRHVSLSIARHDLRALFHRPRNLERQTKGEYAPASAGVDGDVASEVLRRWSLEDVLDEHSADLHRRGELHVEDLGRPHQVLVRSVPAELCLRREPTPRLAFELLGEAAPLVRDCSYGLVVEDIGRILAPLSRARSRVALRDVLAALGGLGAATGRRVDLAGPGGRGVLVLELLRELHAMHAAQEPAPAVFLSWDELAPALDPSVAGEGGGPGLETIVDELLAVGRVVPVWHSASERWVAPGCRRREREPVALACGGAVGLHLPRLARRAGPWREDLLFEELARSVQSALDALERLDAFQREGRTARGEALRQRVGFAVTPVGLPEALRILGDGEVRVDQGARILGLLSDATRRFSQERSLSVVVSPFFGVRARERFAERDLSEARAAQPRLFADLPVPEAPSAGRYKSGYDLPRIQAPETSASRQRGHALAALLATIPSGALFPASSSDGIELPAQRGALATWRAFAALRSEDLARGASTRRVETAALFRAAHS